MADFKKEHADSGISREKWMLARAMIGVVQACNAPSCSGNGIGPAEVEADPYYLDSVAELIACDCSVMMLEDAIELLTLAEKKAINKRAIAAGKAVA